MFLDSYKKYNIYLNLKGQILFSINVSLMFNLKYVQFFLKELINKIFYFCRGQCTIRREYIDVKRIIYWREYIDVKRITYVCKENFVNLTEQCNERTEFICTMKGHYMQLKVIDVTRLVYALWKVKSEAWFIYCIGLLQRPSYRSLAWWLPTSWFPMIFKKVDANPIWDQKVRGNFDLIYCQQNDFCTYSSQVNSYIIS